MKRIAALVFFSLSGILLNAQPNLDSLFARWENPDLGDSDRVGAYNDYVEIGFLFSRPDSTVFLAENLHAYADANDYPPAAARGFRLQGIANAVMGNYPEAEKFFKQSLDTFEEIDDKLGVANNLKNLGNISLYQGNQVKALNYAQKALAIYEDLDDREGIGATLDNLGNLYYRQEEYDAALKYASRSLEISLEFGDKVAIAGGLSNIASIYFSQENYSAALEMNQQALEIYEELGNKQGIALIMTNNGAIHLKLGSPDLAMEFAKEALKLNEELGKLEGVAGNLINIGTIYTQQGDYGKALDYCERGLNLVIELGALSREQEACKCLYDVNKALGNGTEALGYLERKEVIEDSLDAEETSRKLQQMEFSRQMLADSIATAEKERLVLEAHQEEVRQKNQTRNILAGGGLVVLILAGGIYSRLRYTRKAKTIIEKEKDRSENLLLNILPADIAAELKEKGRADARDFDRVSILFSDFKGFTAASEKLSAKDLVSEINICFEAFDGIMEKYGIEKIKTIGDAYMAAGGLPVPGDDSVKHTVLAALEMQAFISKRKTELDAKSLPGFEMRVGVHTGPVVAGIVGVKKFQYDIWGDTVNTASRMESSGEVGKVNISETTYELLRDDDQFTFESRGKIEAKGKGKIVMYFVSRSLGKDESGNPA